MNLSTGGTPSPATSMVVRSEPMLQLVKKIGLVAEVRTMSVLIQGETGTGKELVARHIHRQTYRHGPFVSFNCAAFPESMIEAELFGHERGAYTGADSKRLGLIEQGDQGAVFFDEIGDLPLTQQAKLLRFISEGELIRLGGQVVKVVTRIIAATNKDLKKEVTNGKFRDDLYYRLAVFPITVPPLREHKEDIPDLVELCVRRFNERYNKDLPTTISEEIVAKLRKGNWPGNVRELMNTVERALVNRLGEGSGELELSDFVFSEEVAPTVESNSSTSLGWDAPKVNEGVAMSEVEKRYIQGMLEYNDFEKKATAVALGMNKGTLNRKIEGYGIIAPRKRREISAEDNLRETTERKAIVQALLQSNGNQSVAARALGTIQSKLCLKIQKLGIGASDGVNTAGWRHS